MFGNTSLPIDFNVKTMQLGNNNSKKILIVSYDGKEHVVELGKFEVSKVSEIRIGRTQDNQLVIQSPVMADYQTTLVHQGNDYYIYDGQDRQIKGQYKPSDNGLIFEGRPINEKKKLENSDVIKIRRGVHTVTLAYFDLDTQVTIPSTKLDKEITIGRNSANDLRLNHLDISNFHARIAPAKGGHILEDLGSSNGTWIDSYRLKRGEKKPLKSGVKVKFAAIEFEYDGQFLRPPGQSITIVSQPNSGGYQVKANEIKKEVPKKILLNGISLVIEPGKFVAVVGGSGTGKSTLLGALNGSSPMSSGQVLINGEDLYLHFNKYRTEIGYVPQKDIVHENLTVIQVLRYAAYLRGVYYSKVEESITKILSKVEMDDKSVTSVKDSSTGKKKKASLRDTLVKDLSGGQKKRVSIAVELIADPNIIFLDEPTSGLDPGLDKSIMETLRNISKEGKTIILVTHATENITACHLVAFLAKGGELVFYGPPEESLKYFGVPKFSEIYQAVDLDPEKWINKFKGSEYEKKYIKQPQAQVNNTSFAPINSGCGWLFKSLREGAWNKVEPIRQTVILTQRNWAVMSADRMRLVMLAFLAPLLTALILAFPIEYGLFSSDKLHSLNPQDVFPTMININQTLFMMACIGTFFGLFGSIQEISKERAIYDREKLANLNVFSYVASKLIILAMLALIQSLLLVYVFGLWAKFPAAGITEIRFLSAKLEIMATLFLTLLASSSLGLFVSAWVKDKQDRVMGILAVLVIVQIVFSGILFKLDGWWKVLTWFTLTRWSTEAMGSVVELGKLSVASQLFLTYGDKTHLFQNWLVLLAYTLFFVMGTILVLQNQDITRSFKK